MANLYAADKSLTSALAWDSCAALQKYVRKVRDGISYFRRLLHVW